MKANESVTIHRVANGYMIEAEIRRDRPVVFCNDTHVFQTLPALFAFLRKHYPAPAPTDSM